MNIPTRPRETDYAFWASLRKVVRSSWFGITYFLGVFIDAIKGPSSTTMYEGESKNTIEQLRLDETDFNLSISAREVIYHTRFTRAWIPDSRHTVYEVSGSVNEIYREYFDPRLFQTVTYPMLCTPLLRWTRYPHVYAINAHINRVYPAGLPFRITLK
jgi:hypothetical protein